MPVDVDSFESEIKEWEWSWVNTQKDYAVVPKGNAIPEVQLMHKKYRTTMAEMYKQK